jgi:galactitol-specific phosphotransferase system IIB component
VYAVALEGATAFFVWRSQLRWAIAFAVFSIAHNVAYYMPSAWTFDLFGATLVLRDVFGALLISISLPIAIAAFSHVQAQHKPATDGRDAATETPLETPATPVESGNTPTIETSPSCGHGEATSTIVQPAAQPAETPKRGKVLVNGMTAGEIAALLGTSDANVRALHARGTLTQRIAQLPQPVRVTTNGYHETEVQ